MPEPTTSKPWWQSKTILAIVVSVLASGLAYFTKSPAIQEGIEAESGNITGAILAIVALISSVVAIIGRVVAKTKIESK